MSFDFIKNANSKIHFIGIGGISMSGLAEILLERGYKVSGSDMNESPITNKLSKMGAEIYIGHKSENIKDVDLIVYTAAISKDNPELIKALEANIPIMDRADFLGQLMKGHKFNIAISGTHGKTTTTSMVSHITIKANLDPTILVGGELDIINGNVRTGKSEYFITEACEYKASFLKFFPYIGVILNIDADHLDYYKDIDDIQNTFIKFAKIIPKDGYLIAYSEDDKMDKVLSEANCNIITYGINHGDIRAENITFDDKGCSSFDVIKNTKKLFSIKLNVPGNHNILNALASISIALTLNIKEEFIVDGLESFYGTHRRFELKGIKDGVTVVDDYAHHPTEIKATLSASQNYPHNRIFCVFQPHTYTRTYTLFKEFTECFSGVDKLILADIYAAREKDTGLVSSDTLGDNLREKNLDCINLHSFDDIVKYLKDTLKSGDLLLTVGAGDIYKVGEMFIKE
ncbi:UDP-N-acetylmuramate--L-alanine ligase [Clostridium lundense]|uniref:UDP-N-acetylmuramate--L-alanine ligase n=1 Tax=Clostridium lundense TaxID=319475 RepID=UPI000487B392|nr:UDP-N-acetylmuramate--L-alanine ligase [Clostridium lundense]